MLLTVVVSGPFSLSLPNYELALKIGQKYKKMTHNLFGASFVFSLVALDFAWPGFRNNLLGYMVFQKVSLVLREFSVIGAFRRF